MAIIEQTTSATLTAPEPKIERIGGWMIRYALVLVIFWYGCLKFTAYEAHNMVPLASHSPLMFWVYSIFDLRNFARALGTVEIIIALLLALRPISPKLSILGSLGAIAMFITTLSLMFSTPGVIQPGYGFPALAAYPGGFLLKDTVNISVAIWTLGESLRAVRANSPNWGMRRGQSPN